MIKDYKSLSELTIIVPTFNRQSFAIRNMHYWSGRLAKVIVIDGSQRPIPVEKLSGLSKNIIYIHLDLPFNERILFATERLTTKYAILCCDDEFQVPSGVVKCIDFLEKNQDYAQCCGRVIRFSPRKYCIRLDADKLNHESHFVNQKHWEERVAYHMTPIVTSTIYGVHRVDSFRHCVKYSMNYDYGNPYPQETLFEFAAAAFGKSKVIPSVTWLRSAEGDPVITRGWERKESISDWYDNPGNEIKLTTLQHNAEESVLSLGHNSNSVDVRAVVREILSRRIDQDRKAVQIIRSRMAFEQLVRWLVHQLRQAKRAVHSCMIYFTPGIAKIFGLSFYCINREYSYRQLIETAGLHVDDLQELSEIWQVVVDFHKNSSRF
jgi:glycosyltransferase domain-containing protein